MEVAINGLRLRHRDRIRPVIHRGMLHEVQQLEQKLVISIQLMLDSAQVFPELVIVLRVVPVTHAGVITIPVGAWNVVPVPWVA